MRPDCAVYCVSGFSMGECAVDLGWGEDGCCVVGENCPLSGGWCPQGLGHQGAAVMATGSDGHFSYGLPIFELCRTVAPYSYPSPFRSLWLPACGPLSLCKRLQWVTRLVIAALQGEPFVLKYGGDLLELPHGRLQQLELPRGRLQQLELPRGRLQQFELPRGRLQ